MRNSWNIRLVLIGCLLFLNSCSKETANDVRDRPSKQASGSEKQVDAEEVSIKLKTLVDEFESTINAMRDIEARKTFIKEYAKKFLDLAKELPEGEPSIESWCYAMALGDGSIKKEAMDAVLRKAEFDLDSEPSVKLLGEIVAHGEGSPRLKAISNLKQLATMKPVSAVSTKSLSLLATSKSLSAEVRTDALQHWIDHCIAHEETATVINCLAEHQSAISERWLKNFANQSSGEIKALAVVQLAKYINRRDSIREFWRDAPASRFEGMKREYLSYLNAATELNEQEQLVRFLKSIKSNDEDLIASAESELNGIENLAIGKLVPEIVGTDFDGTRFKLSDYRGQVVLLDFWGDW